MIRNLLALVGLLAVMLLGAAEFNAGRSVERAGEPVRLRVNHRDLDLATPQGVAALEARVEDAVDRICGYGSAERSSSAAERRCRNDARQSAVGQVHAAIYRAVSARHGVAQPLPSPPPAPAVVFAPRREVIQPVHVERVRVVRHVKRVKHVAAAPKAKRRHRAAACPQPARRARTCCCCTTA